MSLLPFRDALIETQEYNRVQISYLLDRVFFYHKKEIISFPKKLYFKYPKNEEDPYIRVPPYSKDYDFKQPSYIREYDSESMLSLNYSGDAGDIIFEPSYLKIHRLRKMFMDRASSGIELFNNWKKYCIYIGEVEENPNKNVIIWEVGHFKYCFNKNLLPK